MFFPPFPTAPFPRNMSKKSSYFYNQITLYQKNRCKRNGRAAVSIATGLFFYAIFLVCTPNRKKVRNDHEKTIAWHSAGVQHGADPAAGGGLCRGGQRRDTGRTARWLCMAQGKVNSPRLPQQRKNFFPFAPQARKNTIPAKKAARICTVYTKKV